MGGDTRVWLDDRTRVRVDLRFRGIEPIFERTSFEWTLGLGRVW